MFGRGLNDVVIEFLVYKLSVMDLNNFIDNVGVGE